MSIHLIAIGNRMPDWIDRGYQEYSKRLQPPFDVILHEIALNKVEQISKAIPKDSYIICLDQRGKSFTNQQLADKMQSWFMQFKNICFIIGGPEGLPKDCATKANLLWSISDLTFPHPLVRVILVEQLYRAWSIIQNHPYHK